MSGYTTVNVRRWIGRPIEEAISGLAESRVEVIPRTQEPGPFGPLLTLATVAVRAHSGERVVALVTEGRVLGFRAHTRATVLETRVVAGEVAPDQVAPHAAAGPSAPEKQAPARKTAAKQAPAKKTAAKKTAPKEATAEKAPAKKAPAKKAPAARTPGKKATVKKAPASTARRAAPRSKG